VGDQSLNKTHVAGSAGIIKNNGSQFVIAFQRRHIKRHDVSMHSPSFPKDVLIKVTLGLARTLFGSQTIDVESLLERFDTDQVPR
jgi:hypothetical protein